MKDLFFQVQPGGFSLAAPGDLAAASFSAVTSTPVSTSLPAATSTPTATNAPAVTCASAASSAPAATSASVARIACEGSVTPTGLVVTEQFLPTGEGSKIRPALNNSIIYTAPMEKNHTMPTGGFLQVVPVEQLGQSSHYVVQQRGGGVQQLNGPGFGNPDDSELSISAMISDMMAPLTPALSTTPPCNEYDGTEVTVIYV